MSAADQPAEHPSGRSSARRDDSQGQPQGGRGRGGPERRDERGGRAGRQDRRGTERREYQYEYIPAAYPKEIPEPPERPDYDQMRQEQEKVTDEISKKIAAINELRAQARVLVARRSGDKSAYIDPVLRQEASELNAEFRTRIAAQTAVRQQLDAVEARTRGLRDKFGSFAGMTEEQFREHLQALTYEHEHTSTSVAEERANKAELTRLESLLPLMPELEGLMKQREDLRERYKAARASVDELRDRRNEINEKMSVARASASEVINEKAAITQELNKVDDQRKALQSEIDALRKKRDAIEAAFTEKLAAVLRVERARDRAILDRRILRRKWADPISSLRSKGVTVEETGEDTGVFTLKNWEVTSLESLPGNEDEYIRSQLVAWCQAALDRGQFGTVTPSSQQTKGKKGKPVGELDFQVLDLLEKLQLPSSRVADKESVEALLTELQSGDKEKEENALRAANAGIQKEISSLEALHAVLVKS